MRTLFVARTNPVEGREAEFNQWYNETHLPQVLQIDGFISAKRYRTTPEQLMAPAHQYVAVYEIDSENVQQTLNNLTEATWLTMSDAIDSESIEITVIQSVETA